MAPMVDAAESGDEARLASLRSLVGDVTKLDGISGAGTLIAPMVAAAESGVRPRSLRSGDAKTWITRAKPTQKKQRKWNGLARMSRGRDGGGRGCEHGGALEVV